MLFVRFIKKIDSSLCLFFYKMNVGVIGETGIAMPEDRGYYLSRLDAIMQILPDRFII